MSAPAVAPAPAQHPCPAAPRPLLLLDLSGDEPCGLAAYLERQGFPVRGEHSVDAPGASDRDDLSDFGAAIVVSHLPNPDAMTAIRRLGGQEGLPVLMVVREGEAVERVLALEIGADDLVGQEAQPREILTRLNRMVQRRRPSSHTDTGPRPGTDAIWTVKHAHRTLTSPGGRQISLTSADQMLLNAFLACADRLILEQDYPGGQIRTAISRLKRKVVMGAGVELPIENVWGHGYRFGGGLMQQ